MLNFTNTLTRQNERFKPLKRKKVSIYNCGPTVYGYVHIGNLRYFVFTDLLRRLLERRGYAVTQVMNVTDVGHMLADADEGEDKILAASRKEGKTPQEIAAFYADAFFRDIDRLGIRRATVYPRASEHVPQMIDVIGRLLKNGCAYRVGGSVYFDVSSFPDYGKLSGNTVDNLAPGARVEVRTEKKHPADFALWIENPKHLLQWEAPWGRGYPGWHIECSAMAMHYLGKTIDIHTGGEDNKFPHHEAEIAQSECASGKPFARLWLHVTHLLVDGEKMSKSKGNAYTLDDLAAKRFAPREVRYLLLATHYRHELNFTWAGLDSAKGALARLDDFADALLSFTPKEKGRADKDARSAGKAFDQALDDDLGVPEALSALFDFVRQTNEKISAGALTRAERQAAIDLLTAAGDALGFAFGRSASDEQIPESAKELIEKREEARKGKRFAEADRLRDEIRERGFVVEDTPEGRRVKRV